MKKRTKPARRRRPVAAPALTPLTIKLAPLVVDTILQEVTRRKRERLPNRSIQAVVTEAVMTQLGGPARSWAAVKADLGLA